MTDHKRTALVTGANRGIGLEVARQLASRELRVFLGSRDPAAGEEAALALLADGLDARALPLDVGSDESVEEAARMVEEMGAIVDVLVNNAGVRGFDRGVRDTGALATPMATWRSTVETNFFGAVRTSLTFVPGMVERGYGRVVNVSSGYGSFGEGLEGPAAYSVSKAALDALTVKLAEDVSGDVKVNACCPGWVRTDMGGASASRSVESGADVVVWLATLPSDGPSGGFFRDRKRIPW